MAATTRIKLRTGRAGANFVQQAGDIVEVSPETARRYVDAGYAEYVDERPKQTGSKRRTPND